MTELTSIEKEFLQYVTVNRWRTSLAAIREAVEDIWTATESLRIIRDYTDHGIAHSIRLVQFSMRLLSGNHGQPLSSEEMCILLSGIYLHDIGMQCDVLRFPEIRKRAEELGARFEVEFTAPTASGYSVDEQKSIRKNHHYLTAAWIDYAYRTGKTVLGPAIKTVPSDLVWDLIDVCIHHTKLLITDCPVSFRFNPSQRKRLVASLLRFADELDVDANRVSIETVRLFRLDPQNSAYWWLHNRTKIVFSAPNLILITVRLHPEDVRKQGVLVHNSFIIGFQAKNQPLLSVLAENGLPFVISSESRVLEDEYAEPLPEDIAQALGDELRPGWPVISLVDQTSMMLEITKVAASRISLEKDRFWDSVGDALELWRNRLAVQYAVLFIGQNDGDAILTIKAHAGLLPGTIDDDLPPHFNWKKAGLTEGESENQGRNLDWTSISFADRSRLAHGFRGTKSEVFASCTGLIPTRFPTGMYGLLALGPGLGTEKLTVQEQVIIDASRDLCWRILSLYLAKILEDERDQWRKTSQLIGHRMRSSLQGISSQLSVINASHRNELGFTPKDRENAESDLKAAFRDLTELSYVAGLAAKPLEMAIASREFIPLGEIVLSAVEKQQDLADEIKVEIIVDDNVHRLPLVWVNRTLIILAFVHLINNGLRYSFPAHKSLNRSLKISSVYTSGANIAKVDVVNFGLGIRPENIERIFDWGVRLSTSPPHFREIYGSGIGLWEARRIVVGHGGLISAKSIHYSGGSITEDNIQECTTTFSITLSVGGAKL